ncbi:MAG: DUF4230 domain-containing protein [Pseudomonadota bacterium]
MKFLGKFAGALALIALFIAGGFWALGYYVSGKMKGPDPVTIASASLQGLKEQNRLSAFAARFVSVTTSTQSQFGLSARKTLIMPGMVRYEVDLAKLRQKDVTWDPGTKTLGVTLPPVEVSQPQIDLTQMREYGEGGLLSAFTDADAKLQEANRRAGQRELVRQAHEAVPLNLARDATRRAVERSFAMPLKAAGVDVTVKVRFADEARNRDEVWDTTRSLEEVLGNRN